MSKETFDFSEALRRMRQGKTVRRQGFVSSYGIIENELIKFYSTHDYLAIVNIDSLDVLADDWEEVEE